MAYEVISPPALVTGQRLTLEEFLRRWEDLPELKKAELIDGVVYLPSPLSNAHATEDFVIHGWLWQYALSTPGCQGGSNATWFMLGSSPQPDSYLRILPAYGGQSRDESPYCSGAPELIVEICVASTEIDFGAKLDLYQRAGVREYITVETLGRRITWRVLDKGAYLAMPADGGIFRSEVFPGLWLDEAAFWASDGPRLLAVLNEGLASEDHRRFAERLAALSPE